MDCRAILIAMLIFTFAQPAHSQNFEVQEVIADLTEVVVLDRATGVQWVVRRGDSIEGWRIAEITQEHVTIVKQGEDGVFQVTNLPINGGGRIITPFVEP